MTTVLSLQIHGCGVFPFIYIFNFLQRVLYCSLYKSFISLVKLISKYFILFDVTVISSYFHFQIVQC